MQIGKPKRIWQIEPIEMPVEIPEELPERELVPVGSPSQE